MRWVVMRMPVLRPRLLEPPLASGRPCLPTALRRMVLVMVHSKVDREADRAPCGHSSHRVREAIPTRVDQHIAIGVAAEESQRLCSQGRQQNHNSP